MRRIVRKPATMTTKQFAARISELNGYLPQFPPAVVSGTRVTRMDNEELVSRMEFANTNSQQRKKLEQEIALIQGYVDSCEGKELIEQPEQRHKSHIFTIVNNDCKIVKSKGKRHPGVCKDDNNNKADGETGAKGYTTVECRGPKAQVATLQAKNYKTSKDTTR